MRFLLVLALVGCGGSSLDLGGEDLSVAMPADLAGVDLAGAAFDLGGVDFASQPVPVDLAGVDGFNAAAFCAGTSVAGTCLQTFFAPLSTCFVPSGSCNQSVPGVVMPIFCWSTGAELKQQTNASELDRTFISGGVICYTEQIGGPGPQKTPWWAAGGQGMFYEPIGGNYDCPDGSKGNIGANYGGCAALGALVAPDRTACMPGACP
jgi:hypothetical protein